ncbi:hypothetical protein BDZ90DRAFT_253314 [Jaminaea rosea]|uniref:NADH-ubiquinone oxidoreductase 21 kDa subunit n=1 Tax=Jaminaea rosea TaxID=1569628 RepID=A0A316US22_9BASI|nr:hypothetical protein BDZ90DRAFT_253314 [Jaminaea rosea]PWN26673.1 hypothetical protein BDZ90DRAFT_253314 [Jaminaea rosea]
MAAHQQVETEFPLIDSDPHFKRVISYMRPSDYVAWGSATVGFPSALYLMEMFDPTRPPRGGLRSAMRLGTFLGAAGGFLFAYQRSSLRLWGWTENEAEVNRAKEEAPDAFPSTGKTSSLEPYMQGVAHRNSVWSQLKFGVMPWFNLVDHPHHGSGPKDE